MLNVLTCISASIDVTVTVSGYKDDTVAILTTVTMLSMPKSVHYCIMPMTHLTEIGAKTGTAKPVPVSGASDMEFGTNFSGASCCMLRLIPILICDIGVRNSQHTTEAHHNVCSFDLCDSPNR